MSDPAKLPTVVRLQPVQTCFACADRDAATVLAAANYVRLLARCRALEAALRRESHALDTREPHRRRVG